MREGAVLHELYPRVTAVNMEVDLEDALDLAGCGRHQLFHCALMLVTLAAALLEMIGIAYVIPAAVCDLELPDSLKGIVTSIPNIGIILTAPFWGRAADSLGRKPTLLVSTAAAGILGLSASMMPNLISFALCKFATSLFLSCPSSLSFAYACELMPSRRRDKAVLLINGLLMVLSTLSPVFAWIVLSNDWQYPLGAVNLRPWRLLTAVYAVPLLITALWLTTAEESPKFLMTRRREEEALNVLRRIYTVNTGLPVDSYSVKTLKGASENVVISDGTGSICELASSGVSDSALALLRPPHLKWLALIGFLMFGLFASLNGLFLMAPDIINKVMTDPQAGARVCSLIHQIETNATSAHTCIVRISHDTFSVMAATTLVSGVLVTLASISPLSKKTLLISMYATVGVACITTELSPFRLLTGVALTALQLTALGIGPLTAYAVHLFPTTLRGTAVGAVMMCGRAGAAAGASAAGYTLPRACRPTFYGFASLTFVCGALSFLLPSGRDSNTSSQTLDTETG